MQLTKITPTEFGGNRKKLINTDDDAVPLEREINRNGL